MESTQDSFDPSLLPVRIAGSAGRRSSNLALALILLPRERRRDAFLFHDFCRTVDDIADGTTLTVEQKQIALDAWLRAIRQGHEAHLPADFQEMIARRKIDRQLLSEILLGMRMDVVCGEKIRYVTFEELRLYCWRVASAVGLISAGIFGAIRDSQPSPVTRYAEELGIALQLTNILRDVAEDAAMNRIYLPLEDLERFGVNAEDILSGIPSPAMTHLLNFQAERADAYFAKAEIAWSEMSVNQRRLMRPARLMSAIYRDLLLAMHRDRYDVFAKKYRVGRFKKLMLTILTLWKVR